jgi:hypothetical protein
MPINVHDIYLERLGATTVMVNQASGSQSLGDGGGGQPEIRDRKPRDCFPARHNDEETVSWLKSIHHACSRLEVGSVHPQQQLLTRGNFA